MMKRLVSLLLAVVMLLGMLPVTAIAAQDPVNPFKDVNEGDWYYDAVLYVYSHGLFNGMSEDTFDPYGTMTRGMFVTVLGRMAGVDPEDYRGDTGFADVAQHQWYAPYVKWAASVGVTNGTGPNEFSPNMTINRQQLATFFVRYFELFGVDYDTGVSVADLPLDFSAVASWAEDAVLKMWSRGLLCEDGVNFDPNGPAYRATAANLCMMAGLGTEPDADPDVTEPDAGDGGSQNTGSGRRVAVYFYDGDRVIDVLYTYEGKPLGAVPDPDLSSKRGYILVGYYADPDFTTPFYADAPVEGDCSVYAKYEEMGSTEVLNLTVFTKMDVDDPELSFVICRIPGSLSNVSPKNAAAAEVKDGTAPVAITITELGGGRYEVAPDPAWNRGSSYELHLGEGWMFEDKAETIRTASFSIHMDEVENLQMSDSIVYVKDTEDMNYLIGGRAYAELTGSLLEGEGVTGSFLCADSGLSRDDLVCIYVNKHPITERSGDADYLDPAVYVRIQSVIGDRITFAPLTAEDQKELYEIPDNFPILVDSLPTEGGTVDFSGALDHAMYQTMIGLAHPELTALPEQREETVDRALEVLNVGDFLTFYVDDADGITAVEDLAYGRITEIHPDGTVTYVIYTRQQVLDSLNLYADLSVSGDQVVTQELREQIEASALAQFESSGFAEDAAWYLADLAARTDGFRNNMNVQAYLLANPGTSGFHLNHVDVIPRLITDGDRLHFGDGVQLSVTVDAEFEVARDDGALIFELSAEFIQEVSLNPHAQGNLIYEEILFIPIPVGVHVGAGMDVKSYTSVGFAAEIYTVEAGERDIWAALKSLTQSTAPVIGAADLPDELADTIHTVGDLMDEIERLQSIIDQNADDNQISGEHRILLSRLWNVMAQNGLSNLEYYNITEDLDRTNISGDLMEMLDAGQNIDAGYAEDLQSLLDRYSDLLSKETDWVTLIEEEMFAKEVFYYGLCIGVEVEFVVRGDLALAIGSNLEYEVGKRYSFWFEIGLFKPTAGSSTMDLIDEQFAFQFYVMGKMGIKAGIRAKLYAGIGSGKIASIGIAAEVGPYIKLYGFYIYEYTRYRARNTQDWISNERMEGAMFLEFGLYFIMSFEAEALGLFEYTHDFVNEEIPLLNAGQQRYYYGFDYNPAVDENVVIYGQTKLDKSLLMLAFMDLTTGLRGCDVRSIDRYNFTLSNPNFHLWYDEDWGVPVVDVDVPNDVRIMQCDLTITYKDTKMPFSHTDMTVTIPLLWTNLTGKELNEYYTASVEVGNEVDGWTTVWTKKVLKGQTFDLPSAEEVKELLGWDEYKYVMGAGYGGRDLTDLTIYDHTAYRFEVQHQVYSVTVQGIQNEDGTTRSKTYYAKFGETFDFSDLESTGTRNPEEEVWTKYKNMTTDCTVVQDAIRNNRIVSERLPIDLTVPVNEAMADAIGSGITAQAHYQDNSLAVVFTFNGIPHDDVTYRVERGGYISAEQYARLEEIVRQVAEDEFHMTMGIDSLTPEWQVPLYNASNFIVNCSAFSGTRSTISYVDNYGVEGTPENPDYVVNDLIKMEGTYVGPMYPISRRGYEFLGWYVADPADVHVEANGVEWVDSDLLVEEFTAQKMPDHDVRLYAKWKPLEYLVTFDEGHYGQELTDGADKMVVVYDSTYQLGYVYDAEAGQRTEQYYVDAYGSLPVPEELLSSGQDQRFVFWYYLDDELYVWLQDFDPTYDAYYRFNGTAPYGETGDWVRIDAGFDPQVKIIKDTTLQSYWKNKVTIPMTGSGTLWSFSSKTVTYERYTDYVMDSSYRGGSVKLNVVDGVQKIVSAEPDAGKTWMFYEEIPYPAKSSFDVGYRKMGVAQDDYLDVCHDAGTYRANVERAEDRVFKKANRFFGNSSDPKLVIQRAHRTTENGSLGTAYINASNPGYSSAEIEIENAYELDIHPDAKLCFSTGSGDCHGCEGFIHSLVPGKSYSDGITLTVMDDPNYYDADMDCSGGFSTLRAPTSKWTNYATTGWYSDSASTFQISSDTDLAGFAKLTKEGKTFEGKTVELTANIDMSGFEWVPAGEFKGTFDGNGYAIYGLYVSQEGKNSGFIGTVNGGRVQDLVIADGYFYSTEKEGNMGAVVGYAKSGAVIDRCVSYATVAHSYEKSSDDQTGGIVGHLDASTVVNCVNYGKVSSSHIRVGGIVGYAGGDDTYVVNCANFGNISGESRTGGIVGVNNGGDQNVYNCINIGNVYGEGVFTGAIVGRNNGDDGYVRHCYYREGSAYSDKYGDVGAVGKDSGDDGYIQEDEDESHYNNCSFDSSLTLARDCGYGTALITALDNAKDESGESYCNYGALAWIRSGPGTYPIPMQTKRREDCQ